MLSQKSAEPEVTNPGIHSETVAANGAAIHELTSSAP